MKIVKTIFLKAPRAHVWKFLVEADKLALWFHKAATDLVPGGDYQLLTNSYGKEGDPICWGKVIEMKAPEKLVHTFTHSYLQNVETTCTWTLEDAGDGTILTLTHDGFENLPDGAFGMGESHDKGWDEHFARLRRVTA